MKKSNSSFHSKIQETASRISDLRGKDSVLITVNNMKNNIRILDVIALIESLPRNSFIPLANGCFQTHDWQYHGNLYLDGQTACNYYIDKPDCLELCFYSETLRYVDNQRCTYHANGSIGHIFDATRNHPNFHDIAQGDNALCVGVRPYKEYKDGIAGEIAEFTYNLVLAFRNYDLISKAL